MNKPATGLRVPDHDVPALFLDRWSPRAFSDRAISEADLLGLLEAARWAPSAQNLQPWRYVYALRGEPAFAAIADALAPANRLWAERAAALVVVASRTTHRPAGAEADAPIVSHAFDAGASWAYLALAAHLAGWATHPMGGFDKAKAAEAVRLPEGHVLHAVVAVGGQGDRASLPEHLQSREVPSPRRPIRDTAHRGAFPA
jgi:nitroreductase